ncbi:hypothetical protein ACHAXR_003043, partial [Thalassiosira sp. AJA248-18]
DAIFNSSLWGEVAELVFDAILKYTPLNEKDIPNKIQRYEKKKRRIINSYITPYLISMGDDESDDEDEGVDDDVSFELQCILSLIGMEFIVWFQRLISPIRGKKRVPIAEQIEEIVEGAIKEEVGAIFDKSIGQRVYYIVGFFCNAGEKEAKRRTNKNDVGRCIQSLNNHFAIGTEVEKLGAIKMELPIGLADMVDERSILGGLKYPNLKLYTAFAVMEKVYSSLSTPQNFTMFGGMLLEDLCSGMIENETIRALFFELFDSNKFSEDTILTAMRYYMKVFGNVRAKDVCYRYNSNIKKGPTVGLRPTLAAGGGGTKAEVKEGTTLISIFQFVNDFVPARYHLGLVPTHTLVIFSRSLLQRASPLHNAFAGGGLEFLISDPDIRIKSINEISF